MTLAKKLLLLRVIPLVVKITFETFLSFITSANISNFSKNFLSIVLSPPRIITFLTSKASNVLYRFFFHLSKFSSAYSGVFAIQNLQLH